MTILAQEISEGLEELERPARGLYLSGLSAGLDIGFGVLAIGVIGTLARGELPALVEQILIANAYSLGFMLVVFGRSELFTEHTTLAALPVLDGRASLRQLLRLWGTVYAGNLSGVVVFSLALAWVGPGLGHVDPAVLGSLARELVDHPGRVIVLSAVLAGWLMGLVSWLVTAGRETMSQIFFVWVVTASIGLAGLHHCIVGSVEMLAAIFVGDAVGWVDLARFLVLATLGNTIGGVVFVAVVKYAHARVVRGGLREPRHWRSPGG